MPSRVGRTKMAQMALAVGGRCGLVGLTSPHARGGNGVTQWNASWSGNGGDATRVPSSSEESVVSDVKQHGITPRKTERTRSSPSHCQEARLATAAVVEVANPESQPRLASGMLVEIVRRRARHLVHLREHDVMRGVWSARDAAGQLLSVLPSEISFVLPGRRYAFRDARAVLEAAETRDPGDLENAWRQLRVGSPPSGLSAADAAGAMYGRSDATAVYAAHLLLADDRTFFARVRSPVAARDPRYRPRTEEQVVSSLRRFRAAPAHSPVPRAFFSAALAALSRPPSDKPTSQSWARGPHGQVVAALEAFALLRASLPQQSVALHILSSLGLDPAPSGAAALLEGLGAWRLNEDIFAKRAGASPSFPAKVLAEAEEAPFLPDPDADIRRDLRHLPVITIDSADTVEIDDGLSVETMEDGRTRVWVHIADPGRYVRLGSPLDLEARQRASTLYQPTEVIPMFPMPLASGPLSLVAGRDSPAFSLTALLGPSGELEALDITPSTIRVSHRLTYEFADAVLAREDGATGSEDGAQASEERGAEGDGSHGRGPEEEGVSDAVISEQLRELMRLGWLRRRFRESQGAFNFERTEARVRVEAPHSEQPRVEVHTRAQESPSSVLVMEMMVLAGEVAAVFGAHYGIPLPFRGHPPTQPPPGEALEVCKSPKERKELVLGTMARSMMCAGQRVAHSALGLEGYVQITSPIRRYCDLLAQFQIKAVLRGDDPPLSHEEMHRIVESCHEKALAIKEAQRDAGTAWMARYLMQRPGRQYKAKVLSWMRQDLGLARAMVHEIALETLVYVHIASPGDTIDVVCTFADPFSPLIRMEQVLPDKKPRPAQEGGE